MTRRGGEGGCWRGKGDTSSGGTWGSCSPEVRGEAKQRSSPQSCGALLREGWMLRSPYQPKPPQPSVSLPASPIPPTSASPQGEILPPKAFPGSAHTPVGPTTTPLPPPAQNSLAGHKSTCLRRSIHLLPQRQHQPHSSVIFTQPLCPAHGP